MITYPVDVENTRWSLWSVADQAIKIHNKPWPRRNGQEIVNLDPDLIPLLEVRLPQPAYDSAIERLERDTPVVDVDANTHTHGWVVVPRPQEEIDDDAEREQAKAVYRALINGAGNSNQRLQRVERVCAFLLKDLFGAS